MFESCPCQIKSSPDERYACQMKALFWVLCSGTASCLGTSNERAQHILVTPVSIAYDFRTLILTPAGDLQSRALGQEDLFLGAAGQASYSQGIRLLSFYGSFHKCSAVQYTYLGQVLSVLTNDRSISLRP